MITRILEERELSLEVILEEDYNVPHYRLTDANFGMTNLCFEAGYRTQAKQHINHCPSRTLPIELPAQCDVIIISEKLFLF